MATPDISTLPSDQITKKEKVGTLDGEDVVRSPSYRGGLSVCALHRKSGRHETISLGSHRAISRFLAKKAKPGIVWTSLAKSEEYPYESYAALLPKWDAISAAVRAKQGI